MCKKYGETRTTSSCSNACCHASVNPQRLQFQPQPIIADCRPCKRVQKHAAQTSGSVQDGALQIWRAYPKPPLQLVAGLPQAGYPTRGSEFVALHAICDVFNGQVLSQAAGCIH